MNRTISPRMTALVTGLSLLLMAILAPIANFGIFDTLTVMGDATATATKVAASRGTFRVGIMLFLIVAVLDVLVAWGLYLLLEPVSKHLSLLAAWLRLAYAAMLALSLGQLVSMVQVLDGSAYLNVFTPEQIHAQAMTYFRTFNNNWTLGLAIFGLHLLVLGYVAFTSNLMPRWLGGLLMIAGMGYSIDSIGKLLIANYSLNLVMVTFIGEVVLIFWLLWRGIKGFDPSYRPALQTNISA